MPASTIERLPTDSCSSSSLIVGKGFGWTISASATITSLRHYVVFGGGGVGDDVAVAATVVLEHIKSHYTDVKERQKYHIVVQ